VNHFLLATIHRRNPRMTLLLLRLTDMLNPRTAKLWRRLSISCAWLLGLTSVLQVAAGSEAEQALELRGTRVMVRAEQSPPSKTYTTRFEGDPKPPPELVEWFTPPEKYRADFGGFRSPLLFADGTPVRTAADWQRRRAEILATWHKLLGP